jgi:heterokaryon incompatibility protein Het-C
VSCALIIVEPGLIVVDIEDMLETIAFLSGKKWTSLMIGRVYFGNWLRQVLSRAPLPLSCLLTDWDI